MTPYWERAVFFHTGSFSLPLWGAGWMVASGRIGLLPVVFMGHHAVSTTGPAWLACLV